MIDLIDFIYNMLLKSKYSFKTITITQHLHLLSLILCARVVFKSMFFELKKNYLIFILENIKYSVSQQLTDLLVVPAQTSVVCKKAAASKQET